MPTQFIRTNSLHSNTTNTSSTSSQKHRYGALKSRSSSASEIPTAASPIPLSVTEGSFAIVDGHVPEPEPVVKKEAKGWRFASATLSTWAKATKDVSSLVLNKAQDWTNFATVFQALEGGIKGTSSNDDSVNSNSTETDSDGSSTYDGLSTSTISATPTQTQSNAQSGNKSFSTASSSYSTYDYYLPDIDPHAQMVPLFSGWTAYRGNYGVPKLVPVNYWDELVEKRREERIKLIKEEEEREGLVINFDEEEALQDSPTEMEDDQTSIKGINASNSSPKRADSWLMVDESARF